MRRTTTTATCLLAASLTLTACGTTTVATPATHTTPTSKTPTSAPALTKAQTMRNWYNGGGQKQLDTITKDLGNVQKDLQSQNLDHLAGTCGKLTSDVETIQGEKRMPDAKAASEWKLALTHLNSAASHCTTGAVAADTSEIEQMTADLTIGLHHMTAVNTRLGDIANG